MHNLQRSVIYSGPAARLLRVMENARQGRPTKIGVLGGSVTKGHGVTTEQNWVILFRNWWAKVTSSILSAHYLILSDPIFANSFYSPCRRLTKSTSASARTPRITYNSLVHDLF